MVDLRKKLLGLTVLATAFAGMSYGQTLCPAPPSPGYQLQPGLAANLLRVESLTEEVSDLNIFCNTGGNLGTGTVTVSLNATVTSKGAGGGGSPNTDAMLVIVPTAAVDSLTANSTIAYYFGTVLPNSQTVVFTNVNFPIGTPYYIAVKNIRVNASQISINPGANQVNETVLVTNAGIGIFAPQSQLVGLVYQGFKAATVSGTTNFLMCQATNGNAGTITISENFGAAFKSAYPGGPTAALNAGLCGPNPGAVCTATNGENGTGTAAYIASFGEEAPDGNAPAGSGLATHGTRFQLAFANIPTGVTSLSVPTSYSGTATATGNFTMQLTGSATGAFTGPLASGSLAISAAGTATAIYEVTYTDNTIQNESISIPVTVTAPANFSTAAQAAFTVVVTPAPQVPLSPVSDIPNFTTATPAPLNLSTWSLCQTTLLFPFVSTVGLDTGIALSNTSLDPGHIGGGGAFSTAAPNQGSCVLNFYGTLAATPGTATTVLGVQAPNPTGGATPYVQPAGTSNSFAIGMSTLVPPGFSGYMIAQCNYLYGHGFAYIAYQLGTTIGSTMGYTANVLNARPILANPTINSELLQQ